MREPKDLTKEELIKEIKIRDDLVKVLIKANENAERLLTINKGNY